MPSFLLKGEVCYDEGTRQWELTSSLFVYSVRCRCGVVGVVLLSVLLSVLLVLECGPHVSFVHVTHDVFDV